VGRRRHAPTIASGGKECLIDLADLRRAEQRAAAGFASFHPARLAIITLWRRKEAPMSIASLKTLRAVCPHDRPRTCRMVVTVQDGRAVALRGDHDHAFTRGFLCQKVARYLDRVYHPERLKWPLRRVGPKGRGEFVRISWDEALDTIVGCFREIAASAEG